MQIELRLFELGLPLLDQRLRGAHLRSRRCDLLRRVRCGARRRGGPGSLHAGLLHLALGAGHLLLGLRHESPLRFDSRPIRSRRGHGSVVLLLRYFFFGHQSLVSLHVLGRFIVIRLGLQHVRLGGLHVGLLAGDAFFRDFNGGVGHTDGGFGARQLVGAADGGDGDVGSRPERRGLGIGQFGLRLSDRNFVIGGIELKQNFSGLDRLVVVHGNGGDNAAHARADRADMRVDLRVVGRFGLRQLVPIKVAPHAEGSHDNDHDHNPEPAPQRGIGGHFPPPNNFLDASTSRPIARVKEAFARL